MKHLSRQAVKWNTRLMRRCPGCDRQLPIGLGNGNHATTRTLANQFLTQRTEKALSFSPPL